MTVAMTLSGALAKAERFGVEHHAGALDTWLITAYQPVTVTGPNGYVGMRSQFLLTLARLDALPDGGYPRRQGTTHTVAMGVLVREFKAPWLDDGVLPVVASDMELLSADFGVSGDRTARDVCRAVAGGFASGDMPMQGRHLGWAFYRSVRMVALALGQGAEPTVVTHPTDSTR